VTTFSSAGIVSVEQGELITFPASFQGALLLFEVSNAPRPDNWTTALYAIQKWNFDSIGTVRANAKTVTFNKTLVKFLGDVTEDFELELRLVNWLPYATVEIWELT
jgi:hypothetical protein